MITTRPLPVITAQMAERFWSKVNKDGDCWHWMGARTRFGYGQLKIDGRCIMAHRIALHLEGTDALGLEVRHMCHTPSCVRPDHLEVGTPKENKRDSVLAGRIPIGEANHNSKLTEDDVRAIRARKESSVVLGREYGVTHRTILLVRHRKTWGHVK